MTIYLTAIGQFAGSLNGVMNSYLGLSHRSLEIQEMIDFMNIPLKQYETGDKTPTFDENAVIEFRKVSFKYPNSDNYALKDIDITIRGNEKLCIVGANGSGKSTFIKLITRLYMPTEGEILLNGVNINEYDYLKYQRLFAPVFQDFCQYNLSVGKNIMLANEYNQERLDEICSKSGLLSPLINKLAKGYHTQVTKWTDEDGFEPSGGEGQRIAIARAVYHGAPISLLDEPTAALDPIAEYEIYRQFNEIITDKTAVLITHRLSAVQLAEKVAVFDNGALIEYGTHKELYHNGGIYTDMYDKQASYYTDGSKEQFI
jgi:ATP-binding cassette subfamily B protein/ATP-binding cassette subfamily C protein